MEGKGDKMLRPQLTVSVLSETRSEGLQTYENDCQRRKCIFMQTYNLHSFALSKVLGVAHLPGSAAASPEQLFSYTTLVWKASSKWVQTSALILARLPELYKSAFV